MSRIPPDRKRGGPSLSKGLEQDHNLEAGLQSLLGAERNLTGLGVLCWEIDTMHHMQ